MGDTFHMQIEEGDGIPNAIRRAGQHWLQHLHAADNTREAPGMGTVPWREVLRALYDIEYEGAVSLEPLPKGASPYDARVGSIPAENLDDELRTGLSHLRDMQRLIGPYTWWMMSSASE
jgi:D-psicose/D-tagatose/L-ribulose 3-epimerase